MNACLNAILRRDELDVKNKSVPPHPRQPIINSRRE